MKNKKEIERRSQPGSQKKTGEKTSSEVKKIHSTKSLLSDALPDDRQVHGKLRKFTDRLILSILIIFIAGIFLLILKSGEIAAKLQVLTLIRMENEKLLKENSELLHIVNKIDSLDQFSKYLNQLF